MYQLKFINKYIQSRFDIGRAFFIIDSFCWKHLPWIYCDLLFRTLLEFQSGMIGKLMLCLKLLRNQADEYNRNPTPHSNSYPILLLWMYFGLPSFSQFLWNLSNRFLVSFLCCSFDSFSLLVGIPPFLRSAIFLSILNGLDTF